MDPNNLAKFRADPSKVRVSVRQDGSMYRATVASLLSDSCFWSTNSDPRLAVSHAIEAADACNMRGIDLDMQGEYTHPMRST